MQASMRLLLLPRVMLLAHGLSSAIKTPARFTRIALSWIEAGVPAR